MDITPLKLPKLTNILVHLIPPSFPLPPALLSTALTARQTYLPPTVDMPDAYITQQPKNDHITRRLEAVAEKLKASQERDSQTVQGEGGIAGQWMSDLLESVRYTRKDEETLLANVSLGLLGENLGVKLINEAGDWKLYDVAHVEDVSLGTEWVRDLPSVAENNLQQGANTEEDFWGGYDSGSSSKSTPQNHTTSLPQETLPEDDAYWASYGHVEDGLRASNPPTPGWDRGMSFTNKGAQTPGQSGQKDYWGTGGETPVSWSPQAKEAPLPAFFDHQEDNEVVSREPPAVSAPIVQLDSPPVEPPSSLSNQASPQLITSSNNNIDGDAHTQSEKIKRTQALRNTLQALKQLYPGGSDEWKEVMKDVLEE